MIHSLKSKEVRWLHALRPTPEELMTLNDIITLPSLLIEELTIPSHRPKVTAYDHSLYLVLHFPVYDKKEQIVVSRELDFVIAKDAVLTVHYDTIEPLEKIRDRLASEEIRQRYFGESSYVFLHHLISELFDFSLNELDQIKKEIDADVARLPAAVRMNPEVYQITHDAVVGRNIELILKEEREKILRENNLNPQTIPGSSGRSVPGSDNDIPTFETYFGAEALNSLVGVGRTIEHECHRHGFKDWPSYYKSLKEEEPKNGPQ